MSLLFFCVHFFLSFLNVLAKLKIFLKSVLCFKILFLKTIALGVKGSDSPNKTASYGVTLVTYQTEIIFLTLKIATWTVEQHPSETVTKLE